MRRSTIPLVVLAALTFFAGLGRGAITDTDEAFYAESAREMVESGDWLTPRYNYEPRFQKPALYYWLTATTYLVTGAQEFAARLWSAIAGLGLVLVTAACGRRWFDEDVGMLAGAIAATCFGYFAIARMALPDLPLAFLITLSIYAAFVATLDRERHPRRWILLASLAAALGFLTKGPVAVAIPAAVVLPVLLMERRSFNTRVSDFLLATLLFLAIAAPWYVGMWMQHGNSYLEGFFIGDNYERFATTRFNDPRPWWFYLPIVLGGLLPWAPLMLLWLVPVWQFLIRRRDIGTLDLRLLLWAALPLVFYTMSVGKQPRYILPVLPPLALLLAGSIIERTRDWRSLDGARVRPRPSSAAVIGFALSGLLQIAIGVLVYRARTLFIDVNDMLTIATAVVLVAGGAAVLLVGLSSAWRLAPGMLALVSGLTFAVLPYGVLPSPRDATVQRVAQRVRAARTNQEPVGTYQVFVRNLVFYTGVKTTDLVNDANVVEWLQDHRGALIVGSRENIARLETERQLRFERLAQFEYFDDGVIKVRSILWPDLAQDLRRILLVRHLP